MDWVRIHPMIANWPGGGGSPTFTISADENGSAVVELAFDPQTLLAPASYQNPLRYYGSDVAFNETLRNADGSTHTVSIPAQTIQLVGNRATWAIPADLWDAYVQESLKTLNTPPTTTFARNIYYRVRVTPHGSSTALAWPPDAALTSADSARAPHIGILPISATPSSQVVPDMEAVRAMGGPPFVPDLFSTMLLAFWRGLPESSPYRQALVTIFAHQVFREADLATRAKILKLWLFAGKGGARQLPRLLDRQAVVGSNLTQPIISKVALRGGKTLIDNLLDLLTITPHKDLAGVMTSEQLLDDVITEILDPNGQVNQGAAGTCSPTSIQTLLITINPSEYARLMVGLLSSSGAATLANGASVSVPPLIFAAAKYGTNGAAFLVRTNSELAFQAALLKFAQGSRFPSLSGSPLNIFQAFQATIAGGLYHNETKRALDALFGVNFTTHEIPWPPQPAQAAFQASQRAIRDGFVSDLPMRQQQMVLAMFWGAPYANPSPPGGAHAVLAVRREAGAGRVFYKNPQYPGSTPPSWAVLGGTSANPPRRYEDPTQALESIADGDLLTWIYAYFVPDAAII
jgi:hypothetical protein